MKKNKTDVILSQNDLGILVTCATRYAIGRKSYMPYLVTGIVQSVLDKLDDKTIGCLIRDIEGSPSLGDVVIDEPMWRNLLDEARMEQRRRPLRD